MSEPTSFNPAEVAAAQAMASVYKCVNEGQSFLLEAGAGAGKTHSLITVLNYLITQRGNELVRRRQQIACITYTNVAKQEIESRTDKHPAIKSDTLHGFCWSVLKDFQPHLRQLLPTLDKWGISEVGELGTRRVEYDLGYRRSKDAFVSIHHDDVLKLMSLSLSSVKFRRLLVARFPIIFIDEYQDTDSGFVEALKSYLLNSGEGMLLGFFGDHWQKIYGTGCGKIEHHGIVTIGKEANFRSVPAVVNCLNRMRPDLQQKVKDESAIGEVRVLHTNNWPGERQTSAHWKGDTPEDVAHSYLALTQKKLCEVGWDFSPNKTKILMLTHNLLAKEQGYPSLPKIFKTNDRFLKKEDPYISFFVDVIEPVCTAYQNGRYGEMLSVLGINGPVITSHSTKVKWSKMIDKLISLRKSATVDELVDYVQNSELLHLSAAIVEREINLNKPLAPGEDEPESRKVSRELRAIQYQEIIALANFIDGHTPFATKHGVKGAEFENVLVVLGRGWNQYNFEQMLIWSSNVGVNLNGQRESFERNRNLFYVVCSRSKKRLALLFTQYLSEPALATLTRWFGPDSIEALPSHV